MFGTKSRKFTKDLGSLSIFFMTELEARNGVSQINTPMIDPHVAGRKMYLNDDKKIAEYYLRLEKIQLIRKQKNNIVRMYRNMNMHSRKGPVLGKTLSSPNILIFKKQIIISITGSSIIMT